MSATWKILSIRKLSDRETNRVGMEGKDEELDRSRGFSRLSRLPLKPGEEGFSSNKETADYGYGDANPDEDTAAAKYGHGETGPPVDDVAKYGYGDHASPPDSPTSPRTVVHRRSSMKQSGRSRRRRVSSLPAPGREEISIQLLGQREPVKRSTSISFSEKVKVKNVKPVSQLTDEPQELWFQDSEYAAIKKEIFSVVRKVEKGNDEDKNSYCTRGLERLMAGERATLKKYAAWDTVLRVQSIQKSRDEYDDEYIADVYKYATLQCRSEAANRAERDALEAETYSADTRVTNRQAGFARTGGS
jgi:hypothetical protein